MKIYSITNDVNSMIYYGITTLGLKERFSRHRAGYTSWLNKSAFKCSVYDMFDIVGVINCKINLVDENVNSDYIKQMEKEKMKTDENCINIKRGIKMKKTSNFRKKRMDRLLKIY